MNKHLLLTLISLCCFLSLAAQDKKHVKGIVKDAVSGEPLIGVVVVEENGKGGAVTDIDGVFEMDTNQPSLLVSYVGYEAQKVEVRDKPEYIIRLKPSTELDEVIVVGYTAMKKRDVLGSLSKVSAKDLDKLPVSSTSEALQGRVSGVQVSTTTGAPGAGVSVRVRGVGSINSSNEPLYIIDGIPSDNGLNAINPSDIQNITVLKDASTAAVYGSRASNGVVLVTTKKGELGKPQVSYNGQTGFQTHGHLPKMANTSQYVDIYNVAATNDGRELIQGKWVQDFADVNHLKEIFRAAWLNSHEISVRGGKDKVNYLTSVNYFNQEGIIRNSDFEKVSARANLNYKTTNWLKIGFDANFGHEKTNAVPSSGDGYQNNEGGSVVRYAIMRNPAIPIYDQNGNYADLPSAIYGASEYNSFFGDGLNPYGLAMMTDRVRKKDIFLGKVYTEVTLPYNTIWTTNFGVDYTNNKLNIHNNTWGTNDRINNPSSQSRDIGESFGWTLNSVFNSIHTFNEVHNLNVMLGTEAIRYHGHDSNASSSVNGDTYYKSRYAYSLFSLFAKADYNYNNKYYLSALIREDGSSRFTKGNRWGTFYSVSGGWDVNEESFLNQVDWISLLKLRAGWGAVGNQNIGLYAYTDKYTPYANYPFGGNPSIGYVQSQLGNEKLKWETSNQFNIGLDFTVLKGQLGFSVDYFNKTSKDMLLRASLPPSMGNAQPYFINTGKMRNRGFDFEVFARKDFGELNLSLNINWSILNNKILEIDSPLDVARIDNGVYAKKLEAGYSVGSFFLYEMDGIFQNETEIIKSAYQGGSVKPGDVKYKDQNGDGVIDAKDRVHTGSSIPKHTLGVNLAGAFRNWDLSIFFQGAFGYKIYNQIATESEGFYRGFNVTEDLYENYWRGEGTSNTHPRPSWSAKSNNVLPSTRFLESGSYLRLKNIQLGYSIPLRSKFISRLRVYGSATNLFTITPYKGLDPEMTVSANSSSEGDKANGIDWGTYPTAKTFTIGVNVTF